MSGRCLDISASVLRSLALKCKQLDKRVSERWLLQGNPWDFPREGLACSACLLSCASAPVCLRSWLTWLSYANRASLAMTGSQRACWGCPLHVTLRQAGFMTHFSVLLLVREAGFSMRDSSTRLLYYIVGSYNRNTPVSERGTALAEGHSPLSLPMVHGCLLYTSPSPRD